MSIKQALKLTISLGKPHDLLNNHTASWYRSYGLLPILSPPISRPIQTKKTCYHTRTYTPTLSGSPSSSLEVMVKYKATWGIFFRFGLDARGTSPLINFTRWLSLFGGVLWWMTGDAIFGWIALWMVRVI